jgi:hypothetical protein
MDFQFYWISDYRDYLFYHHELKIVSFIVILLTEIIEWPL